MPADILSGKGIEYCPSSFLVFDKCENLQDYCQKAKANGLEHQKFADPDCLAASRPDFDGV